MPYSIYGTDAKYSPQMDRKYTEDLIKGKITETIFEEMFRTSGEYTVLPLGYEHTTPILAQYQHLVHVKSVLANLRNAPDFALISDDKKSVFLVEVRYKSSFDSQDILKDAQELYDANWNPCFLFVASRSGFHYGSVKEIIHNHGVIEELPDVRINKQIQNDFLNLLNSFIK
jgi:hypothetical protein